MQNSNLNFDYKFGFSMPEKNVFKAQKGLTKKTVEDISDLKNEPVWMKEFRLKSYSAFIKKKMPIRYGAMIKQMLKC